MLNLQKVIDESQALETTILVTLQQRIIEDIQKCSFPYTGQFLFNSLKKIYSIQNSIVDILDQENVYPAFILFRSLIEHYFQFYYGISRFQMEKKDSVGTDYYQGYSMAEFLSIELQNMTIKELLSGVLIQDKFEKVLAKHNDLKIPDGHNRKLNDEKKDKFNFKKILKFCLDSDLAKNHPTYKAMHEGNIKFIIDFNKYSTFVHGGPIGDIITNRVSKDVRNSEEFFRVFSMSFIIAKISGMFFLEFLNVLDEEFYKQFSKPEAIETYFFDEE